MRIKEKEMDINNKRDYPKTLLEAVEKLFKELSQEEKEKLRDIKENKLSDMHFALGAYIRNTMGLYQGNKELIKACGKQKPDDCSGVIIKALWERMQEDADVEGWLRGKQKGRMGE